jgi:hypothetical protein
MSQVTPSPPHALLSTEHAQGVGEDCRIIVTQWLDAFRETASRSVTSQSLYLRDGFLSRIVTIQADLESRLMSLPNISPETALRAAHWLNRLRGAVQRRRDPWDEPLITTSPECEIVFEWWAGDRKLTVYCSDEGAEFIRVWGPDIDTQMDEGDAEDETATLTAWQWLMS